MPPQPRKRAQSPTAHPSELIRRPDLPPHDETDESETVSRREMVNKAYLTQRVIRDADFSKLAADRVFFDSAFWSHVNLSETEFDSLDLADVRFEVCDLSNGIWHQASLNRVEIVACRSWGVQLNESTLRHVVFEDCNLTYAQFRASKFEHVKFVNCNLQGADFSQSDLRGVAFTGCELRAAEFASSKLKGADLRKSTLDNIKASAESLQGAIVEPMQAAYLARIMGLDVRYENES